MATNIVPLNVYQINQGPIIPLINVVKYGFPTSGVLLHDCTLSPARDLGNGISVYTGIQLPVTFSGQSVSSIFYVQETISTITTLFNA